MTTREWLEELTGHVRGGHVVRNDDAARLLDLLQRMQADVQGNWEAWQAAIARADTAEAALARVELARDEARDYMTQVVVERNAAIARAETAEAVLAQCQHDLTEMIESKEYFRQCWEVAEAALAERDTPCMWRAGGEEGIVWYTACDQAHYFDEEGPMENSYQFCPYCGHPIKVQP